MRSARSRSRRAATPKNWLPWRPKPRASTPRSGCRCSGARSSRWARWATCRSRSNSNWPTPSRHWGSSPAPRACVEATVPLNPLQRPPMRVSILRRRLPALLAGLFFAATACAADQVVLKVGDQNYYNIRASVELSKALEGAPYTVEWAGFQAAAPLSEALNAGAIDIGFLGDSGFLFLASKSSNVRLIGVTRQNPKTVALLVPKNSTAKTIADLKGKKVAYWPGAWSQQLTLGALDKAGLSADHVQFVKLMPLDAATALPGGSIDAFPVWEPYVSQQIV